MSDTKSFVAAKAAKGPLPAWEEAATASMTVKPIELDSLDENPQQARKFFDETKLFEQASNILLVGLKAPISASPVADNLGRPTGRFYIVAGERRVRSYRLLLSAVRDSATAKRLAEQARKTFSGEEADSIAKRWESLAGDKDAERRYSCIPAVVEQVKDAATLLIDGLTENLFRENLRALEEADGFANAVKPVSAGGAGLTAEQVASRIGKDVQYVRRRLQLAGAPEVIRKAMTEGILVTKRDDSGKIIRRGESPDAPEAQERRTIEDTSIALELAKLYGSLTRGLDDLRQKKARAAAEERFGGLLDQALSRRWSVRKLEEVRKEVADPTAKAKASSRAASRRPSPADGGSTEVPREASSGPAWESDGEVLTVHLSKLKGLTVDERSALKTLIREILVVLV